jgi:hypothetical protein
MARFIAKPQPGFERHLLRRCRHHLKHRPGHWEHGADEGWAFGGLRLGDIRLARMNLRRRRFLAVGFGLMLLFARIEFF